MKLSIYIRGRAWTFELASADKVQRFLDSEYYIFLVKATD